MTGWSWEYVEDEVTIPRLDALQRYWTRYTPTHIAGARQREKAAKGEIERDQLKAAIASVGGMVNGA